jgi:hypothetical protein
MTEQAIKHKFERKEYEYFRNNRADSHYHDSSLNHLYCQLLEETLF